jgi:hypothetical protein
MQLSAHEASVRNAAQTKQFCVPRTTGVARLLRLYGVNENRDRWAYRRRAEGF